MEDIPEMAEFVKNFSLKSYDNNGFSRVLLQLFGFLGHGKSSFINTCKYVLDDAEYKNYAAAASDDGGHTTERITYPLTDTLTLVDNRGCNFLDDYESGEIFAQLGNLLPLDCKVEWSKDIGLVDRIVQAERHIQSSDFIFPIFVYSVRKGLSSEEVPEIKKLLNTARDLTGIFPVVVLTHKTDANLREVEAKFKDMDVERIISLENFTPEDHIKTRGKHEAVLKFFIEVIKDIEYRLQRMSDPEEEREKRKQFVLQYVYKRELEKKAEEIRRECEREKKELNDNEKPCTLQ